MEDLINKILMDLDFKRNPYFVRLHDGKFEREDFMETQIQFFFAVVFFNRPMSALAAKIPTEKLRIEILKNIWEEHGEGNLAKAHSNTFVTFLSRLGNISEKEIIQRQLWPEVRIFNTCLSGACILDDYMIAVPMMGIIERMFCEISTIIGQGVIAREWLTEKNLTHYNLHAKLDIKHSQDFFNIVKESWDESNENKYYIEQGLHLGATLFNNLYKNLYYNRKKRILRHFHGPHSRAAGVLW